MIFGPERFSDSEQLSLWAIERAFGEPGRYIVRNPDRAQRMDRRQSVILDGTVIGENSIVVDSLVNRRFPPNCIIQGNPAKVILKRA